MFFDTHIHLDYVQRATGEPLAQLIQNARSAKVDKMLIVAVKQQDFANIVQMRECFANNLRYGLGLHPLYIEQHQQADLDRLAEALSNKNQGCTAVGEIGLERAVSELLTDDLWRKQCDFFEAQLQLAKQYQLPINVHSRKAYDQIYPLLKRVQPSRCGIIHGFAGSYQQAKRFVDLGYKIGVGGTITYQRANKTRETISKLPLDALLLETDSPDMPVCGFQGQPNRAERIVDIFQVLCQLRPESATQIQQQIWQNSLMMFG